MTADPTLAAILANILDHPDEDLPRLAFADRCDDLGLHDRAEFVRVQVEAARLRCSRPRTEVIREPYGDRYSAPAAETANRGPCGKCPECDRVTILLAREAAMLDVAAVEDWAGFPAAYGITDWWYRRGFVAEVKLPAADWVAHADAILQAHPVQRVTLTTWPEGTATRANRLRKWKQPSRLGGHVLDSWRAEWPGVAFTLSDLPGHLPGVGERIAAHVAAQLAREDFEDSPPPRAAFGTATAADVADAMEYAREQDRLDAEGP